MATSDKQDNAEVMHVLQELRGACARLELGVARLDRHVTGGDDTRQGLSHRVAQLETCVPDDLREQLHDIKSKEESRSFWMRTIGATAVGSFVAALGSLLFKGGHGTP
jgi:hypothetical protein